MNGCSRNDFGGDTHVVDLADTPSMVAVVTEHLGKGDDVRHVFTKVAAVPEHPVCVRIQAGHHRRAGGTTYGILAVHVLKAYAALGQLIELGGLALGMTKSTESGIEIIRHQEKNVGLFSIGQRKGRQGKEEKEQGGNLFHGGVNLSVPAGNVQRDARRENFWASVSCAGSESPERNSLRNLVPSARCRWLTILYDRQMRVSQVAAFLSLSLASISFSQEEIVTFEFVPEELQAIREDEAISAEFSEKNAASYLDRAALTWQKVSKWMRSNQRESGKWFKLSPVVEAQNLISNIGSAYVVLALQACGELPGWPLGDDE